MPPAQFLYANVCTFKIPLLLCKIQLRSVSLKFLEPPTGDIYNYHISDITCVY